MSDLLYISSILKGLLQRVQAAVETFLFWDEEVRAYEQREVCDQHLISLYIINSLVTWQVTRRKKIINQGKLISFNSQNRTKQWPL